MPQGQLQKVVSAELGPDWRSKMASFEDEPLAAASIGQVSSSHNSLLCLLTLRLLPCVWFLWLESCQSVPPVALHVCRYSF